MKFRFTIDLRHWMVGISFEKYNALISIGPLNIWVLNNWLYKRHMEKQILNNFNNLD